MFTGDRLVRTDAASRVVRPDPMTLPSLRLDLQDKAAEALPMFERCYFEMPGARAAADAAVVAAVHSLRDAADAPEAAVAERMTLAVQHAHAAVLGLPDDAPWESELAEPQATPVLALIVADRLWYAWVGDSRIFENAGLSASLP